MTALQEQGRQLARGTVPQPTLAAVAAYADFLRFGQLPYQGGSFEQPDRLMRELRIVHDAYSRESEKRQNRESRRAQARSRRR